MVITIHTSYSQNEDSQTIINMIKDNQLSFTLQMYDIVRNCQVISDSGDIESKSLRINYQRSSLIQEDYWMALVSLKTAKFLFQVTKSDIKNHITNETYQYLEKILFEDWPQSITGENIVGIKMNLYFKFLTYHSEKSPLEKEFSLLLNLDEIDMDVYTPK